MWKDYSLSYIKNNKSSAVTIITASFIAALFLAFLCSLFYNFWLDNIRGTELSEGSWHGRITIEKDKETSLSKINNFANVEKVVINKELSGENKIAADIYFQNKRQVYNDMSEIINMLGLEKSNATYNYQLLSLYFIRIPGDKMPRLLMPSYLVIVVLVCFSLVLIIHGSFAVSMNSRIHQFGILSSTGASPGQIRACLLQEALMLSIVPVIAGIIIGNLLSFITTNAMGAYAKNLAGGRQVPFSFSIKILILVFILSFFTILISAWLPARKLSRITPLEAIHGTDGPGLKKKKHSPVLYALCGIEGELAGNYLKAQKKALRSTSISLLLAFSGFMLMQCFFTFSGISTKHTYFEAYKDVWDIMVSVKASIEEFGLTSEIQGISGVKSSIIYQKEEAECIIPAENLSQELLLAGGIEKIAGSSVSAKGNSFVLKSPVIILNNKSFIEFCRQAGISPQLDGTIILNSIWDSIHSNFRNPEYIPCVNKGLKTITLQRKDRTGEKTPGLEIPVLACTGQKPALREEYGKDSFGLVQFVPLSLWEKISGYIGNTKKETYICVLADNRTDINELNILENKIVQLAGKKYKTESENRIQEKITNNEIIKGYKLLLGGFCVLFAIIGVVHVFYNTLGFLRQRKREFARYMSIGMTTEEIKKIFFIEALITTGLPLIISSAITIAAVIFMLKASYLNPQEFINEAPVIPVLLFILAVSAFTALAYWAGGKKILKINLAETLRNDTLR